MWVPRPTGRGCVGRDDEGREGGGRGGKGEEDRRSREELEELREKKEKQRRKVIELLQWEIEELLDTVQK